MAFWSGETIQKNSHVVSEFNAEQIDCNAYKICMGDLYFTTSDQDKKSNTKRRLNHGETISVPAGQFAFLLSKEKVEIPTNTMGFISMRTGFKFKGLINVSGFNVDPGYKGKLLFAVYNAGSLPVYISGGEPIFKIWFAELDNPATFKFYSKAGIYDIDNELVRGASKEIFSLQSLSDKIRDLETNFDKKFGEQKPIIDNLSLVWRTATIGVIGTILISILTLAWPTLRSVGDFVSDHLFQGKTNFSSSSNVVKPVHSTPPPNVQGN